MTAPQLLATDFTGKRKKIILGLDKGMGKTIVYLISSFLAGAKYIVILCPRNAMSSQRRDILKYIPEWSEDFTFVRGQKAQRAKQWASGKKIFITTAATFQADLAGRAGSKTSDAIIPKQVLKNLDVLVADEFQKFLRNRTSKTFHQLKEVVHKTATPELIILSSGSAVSKGPQDIWPALHLLDPKLFSSYWKYVDTYCVVDDTSFGKQIIGPKNVESWRRVVGPYFFFRRKDTRDYPPKQRMFLDIELDPWQQKLHDDLRRELLAITPDQNLLLAKNSLEAIYKCRLSLICPKVLHPSYGYGTAIETITDDITDSELSHAVVSTPFRTPIPHLEAYLHSKGLNTWTLTGGQGIDADEMDKRIAAWTQRGGVMIQTIKFAQSYELLAAQNMYMLGAEWDPEENKQAEDRIHRLTSDKNKCVNIWYTRHLDTYEETLLEGLMEKSHNIRTLTMTQAQIRAIFKGTLNG